MAGWELIWRGGAARLDRSVVRAHHELGLHPLAVGRAREPQPHVAVLRVPLLVGDSLTSQMFHSVKAILAALPPPNGGRRGDKNKEGWWDERICGGGARLTFVRNNALSLATRADTPLERGFLKPWIDRLHQHDVVVLNTGTSATGAPAEIADVISRAVDHALANTPLTTTIVYRDTPFGHDRCAAHKGGEPLESNAAAEDWLRRHPGPARYNWSNIPKVNAAARLALEDRLRHPSRLLWLPAASISATRIDAHPANAHPATDCLHYCMPGVPDVWTHALFHLLATKPLN